MKIVKENEYIEIAKTEKPPLYPHITHLIFNKSSGDPIGSIEYYKRWRQHVFTTFDQVVWSASCLQLVIDFLNEINK